MKQVVRMAKRSLYFKNTKRYRGRGANKIVKNYVEDDEKGKIQ